MRTLALFVALIFLPSAASAQIASVYFKDPADAAKYKNCVTLYEGNYILIGEPFENVSVDPVTSNFTVMKDVPLSFLVGDSADPTKVPYKFEAGQRVVTNRKQLVKIPAAQVGYVGDYMLESSLAGLAQDYLARKKDVDALSAARDAKQKGSAEWMVAHQRLIVEMEKLVSWLDSTCYPEAAKRLLPELVKQKKLTSDAAAARGLATRGSVKSIAVPAELIAAAESVSGGKDVFKVQASTHCRIVYPSTIDDARIKSVLEFLEQVIEGFRIEFVDPYVDATLEDSIPDHVFTEFFFTPDDDAKYEGYMPAYYHNEWGDHKAEQLAIGHSMMQSKNPPEQLHYYRYFPHFDLDRAVAHDVGHDLVRLHYDRNRQGSRLDWLQEGVARYITLEWCGAQSTACTVRKEPSEREREVTASAQKTMKLGVRDYQNALALKAGLSIEKLATRRIGEFDNLDLATGWSFLEFISLQGGRPGVMFLRAYCDEVRTEKGFVDRLRTQAETIFDVHGQDAFGVIQKRWLDSIEGGKRAH